MILVSLILTLNPLAAKATNPELIEGEKPAYPECARNKGIEGTVVVEALVDENGKVFAADVVESVDPALDAATVIAVQDWKFACATVDGKPVMKVVRIPVEFNLMDSMNKSVAEADAIASK